MNSAFSADRDAEAFCALHKQISFFTQFSHSRCGTKKALQAGSGYKAVPLLLVNFQKSLDIFCVDKVQYAQ